MTPLTEVDPSDLAALSPWAVQLAQTFVALAGDIALLVDARGVITQVALGASVLLAGTARQWVGRAWIDTVSGETRPKIERLLADVAHDGRARTRQVNHPSAGAPDVPVAYSAVRLGEGGPVLVLGREMAEASQLQRRFTQIQQEMERGYWRSRESASQQARLIHAATDCVVRVDDAGMVRDANAAAGALFGRPAAALGGVALRSLFDPLSHASLEALLASTPAEANEVPARPLGSATLARVGLVPWPGGIDRLLRVRVLDADPACRHRAYTRLVDRFAEAVFITDGEGRMLAANPALLHLSGAAVEAELLGLDVEEWLHCEGGGTLPGRLQEHGLISRGHASLRAFDGRPLDVVYSASLMGEGVDTFFGITLHPLGPAAAADRLALPEWHAAMDRLAHGLGQRRLPELLDEARTLAEQHLIRAALDRSGGNHELAAELLGIRQSDLARRSRRGVEPGATRH